MAAHRVPVRPDYSDLEVVPPPAPHDAGLEVYNDRNDPEVVWAEYDPTTLPVAYGPYKADKGWGSQDSSREEPSPPPPPTICGIRRKTFCIVVGVAAFLVVAGAVGGGLGWYFTSRDKKGKQQASSPDAQNPYLNLSLSALHWIDADDVGHYRVYHQPAGQARVFESAWSTDDETWAVSPITDDGVNIKEGTPIASSAGYPHTNTSNDLVTSVYLLNPSNSLIERQSPYKTQAGVWGNDNLSGQYTTSLTSTLFSYWYQDFSTKFQVLAVLFQDFGANSLTISKYVENVTDGEPWRTSRQSMVVQDGSAIAAAPAGDRRNLRMYVGGADGKMKQYPYYIQDNELGTATDTPYDLPPNTPICVTAEDNRNFYTSKTLPECAQSKTGAFLTHLILFAAPDRKDLTLVSWNCSTGFVTQNERIEGLLKPGRTYLDLAAASTSNLTFVGDRVYVLFDEGRGPEIEEWGIPASGEGNEDGQNGPWRLIGSVPTSSRSSDR